MNTRGNQTERELLDRLLGTAMQIQTIAEAGELSDLRRARTALEGLRQRLSRDIRAIDAYLKRLP